MVLFPLYALPLLELVVVPPFAVLSWLRLRNAACLFSLTATFYYLLYELLHLSYRPSIQRRGSRSSARSSATTSDTTTRVA